MTDLQQHVGVVVKFACHPYHYGTGKIVEIVPRPGHSNEFKVKVVAIEATETSRLFGHTSKTSVAGREFELHYQTVRSIERAVNGEDSLSYTYPV